MWVYGQKVIVGALQPHKYTEGGVSLVLQKDHVNLI